MDGVVARANLIFNANVVEPVLGVFAGGPELGYIYMYICSYWSTFA